MLATLGVILLLALPLAAKAAKPKVKPRHSHRFLVAQKLQRGLAGTPLSRLGFEFEKAGWKYNVNPYLVAAIAGTESSFGAAACGGNAWGINSCATTFPTFREGLWYTTRLLRRFYIDLGYDTIWEIGGRYAACGACWANHTLGFMRSRFGSGETVTYPKEGA